jgi:hypothetical protein
MTVDLFMEILTADNDTCINIPAMVTLLVSFALITSCNVVDRGSDSSTTTTLPGDFEWLIPENEVVDGGPGKDGIPSIDDPKFAPVNETGYDNKRRVLGIKIGDQVRAYPHQIMDWHEIVNDRIGETAYAVTYCPLTGTGIGWNRTVDGERTEFGVSGLLFRNNLIPYDRKTDSRWSQMQMRGVHGIHSGQNIETIDMIETTWETWKSMYPDSEVLTTDTGFNRDYGAYAYGITYATNHSNILFPINNNDSRLENKVRVHGVIAGDIAFERANVRVYELRKFGEGITTIHDELSDTEIVLVGSSDLDFAASFETVLDDGTRLSFEPVQGSLPIVMEDQEGNKWDIFGRAQEGPRAGEQLQPTQSYTGYWFAWADFFPGLEIYGFDE